MPEIPNLCALKGARELLQDGRVTGVKLLEGDKDASCEVCMQSKVTRKAIPAEAHLKYGDKLHSDEARASQHGLDVVP